MRNFRFKNPSFVFNEVTRKSFRVRFCIASIILTAFSKAAKLSNYYLPQAQKKVEIFAKERKAPRTKTRLGLRCVYRKFTFKY